MLGSEGNYGKNRNNTVRRNRLFSTKNITIASIKNTKHKIK